MSTPSASAAESPATASERDSYEESSASGASSTVGPDSVHARDGASAHDAFPGREFPTGIAYYVKDGQRRAFNLYSRFANAFRSDGFSRVHEADFAGNAHDHEFRVDTRSSFIVSLRAMFFSSWVNALLIFVPIGTLSYLSKISPVLTFTMNMIAIVPLSSLLTDATERIAADSGDTIGALINISLGNLVELILFVVALLNNQIRVVQASILGSILVNLLLILGSALLASSVVEHEPLYNTNEAQLLACLLFVSVFVFLMPTAFDYTFDHDGADAAIVKMSRMSAIMVFLIYLLYFAHEMRSRAAPVPAYSSRSSQADVEATAIPEEVELSVRSQPIGPQSLLHPRTIRFADDNGNRRLAHKNEIGALHSSTQELDDESASDMRGHPEGENVNASTTRPNTYQPLIHSRRTRSLSLNSSVDGIGRDSSVGGERPFSSSGFSTLQMLRDNRADLEQPHNDAPHPRGHSGEKAASVAMLILTSALMSMCAEFLVSTIDDITRNGSFSESLIGLIIIPIVGNLSEYVTVVSVAAKGKLDLAIAVSVGSSIQIAICVTPLTVMAGWVLQRNFALTFSIFEMAALLGTVLLVNLLVLNEASSNLRTRGLKGALMCACYVIIGFGAYLSPDRHK